MGPMYGPGIGPQRVPQYVPGPQQGHLRPPQGLKRPYSSEVSPDPVRSSSSVIRTTQNQKSFSSLSPQAFPGMSQQYGVPVGSSVNLMSGGSVPGPAGGGHAGTGPYSGPGMQYHPGLA